jgi:predicted phosphate transport protein (TIGR00153 family)
MGLRLFPKEESFFDLFNQAADNILQGARMLRDLLDDYRDVEPRAVAIKAVEDKGDSITHMIIDRLNRTFVTPLDREDIYDLAKQLDNVLDWIEAAAARMAVYQIPQPTGAAQEMGHIISNLGEALVAAIANLKKLDRLDGPLQEIHRLENLADTVQRIATAALFVGGQSAIDVIKWKEIYETLEEATDQGEDVANVLEGIRTKHM